MQEKYNKTRRNQKIQPIKLLQKSSPELVQNKVFEVFLDFFANFELSYVDCQHGFADKFSVS